MNFSALSIRRPIPAILLFVMLTLCGLFSFQRMQIQDLPDIDLPAVTVAVVLPGATPTQMETEVTRKVESALATLSLVEHVSSSVIEGASETTLTFRLDKDMREAVEEVRSAVAAVRGSLPTDVRDPLIARVQASGTPILTYSVSAAAMDETDLSWFVDDTVAKALLNVPGIGTITRHGGVRREVLVALDATRLQSLGVTAADVSQQILLVQQDAAGGHGRVGGGEQSLRSVGTVQSAADLANLPIPLGSGLHSVRLGDLASVNDGVAERRSLALLDGRPVVSFQVMRAKGSSEVTVAEDVRAALAKLSAQHPNVRIAEVSDSVTFTQTQYEGSMRALYEGAVLTIIVVWLFLRDGRATFISAIALPLSAIPTFFVMYLLGYTLNMVTLLSLTLVVGVLVDDAIVEVENIVRHLNMGKTPFQAAMEAADEIGMAVIATSFALVAVFLPTAFIGGVSGRIFQQFGWTASVAVLASLVVARLLTPMMAAYLLKPAHAQAMARHDQAHPGPVMRRYLAWAGWCLAHPLKTCAASAVFFVLSMALAFSLPVDFIPAEDTHEITVNVTAPPGQGIEHTAALAEAVRAAAMQEPEVRSVFASIGLGAQLGGDGPTGIGDVDSASVLISLKKDKQRKRQAIEASLRQRLDRIPGARFAIGSGEPGEKYSVVLSGDDPAQLQAAARAIETEMRALPGFGNVSNSSSLMRPEIVIRRDPVRASDLGVSTLAISQVLRIATGAEYDTNLSKLQLPSRQVSIRVRLDERSRSDLDTLSRLRVNAKNGTVPLSSVATLALDAGPTRIDRLDRARHVTIDVELNGRPLGEAAAVIDALPSMQRLPASVKRLVVGELQAQQDLVINFSAAIVAGVLCVYFVLVLLLNNFLQPFTILSALPLAVGGAFAALWALDFGFSMPSMIGVMMLLGVVTKNSILLVDYAVLAQQRGLPRVEAVLEACSKRARPIVMTTVAMVFGMLPLALGLGGDSSFRAPMAVVVMGGLLSSTLLSLLVVPVVYTLVDAFRLRVRRIVQRKPLQQQPA